MKIQPLSDHILVRVDAKQDKSKGGILIPDNAKQRPQRGEVLAVGPGRLDDNGNTIAMSLELGQVVLFTRYAGNEVREAGEDLLILREAEVLGTVE